MHLKNSFLSLVLSTAAMAPISVADAATVDHLHMKNGDRLSGTITSYTSDMVTIHTVFGVLDVPVANIGGVASPRFAASELLAQNQSPNRVQTNTSPNVDVAPAQAQTPPTSAAPVETSQNTDDEMDAPKTGLWGATWSGDVNAALEIETGNSDSKNYALDASAQAEWANKNRLKLSAEYENEKESGATVTDEKMAEIVYDHFLNQKWFWENRLRLEQDDIEDLDLRVNYLSGLGYRAIDTDTTQLQFVLGPGYLREDYNDQGTETSLTVHWATEYDQKFYDDLFRLYHDHNLTTPADEMDAYLFESDTGITFPIKGGVKVSGEVEFDWNNDPAVGNKEDDTTYNVKLGYEW